MNIGNKILGETPFVIAEAGVNHNGNLDRAKELIIAAAKAGADAIKFQTYTADELVVKGTPKFWDWDGDKHHETQYDAYKAIGGFPFEWYPDLIQCCAKNSIEFLSTPFSFEAADFLDFIGMKAFKVASSDMSTLPFLRHIAKFKKPILLSTGASTLDEIKEAVKTIEDAGNDQIVILHCTLSYPTDIQDANLNVLRTLQKTFPKYVIGLSDHTLGITASIIAVALGAKVIEKHFTIDKTLGESADHWLSVDPFELQTMIVGINDVMTLRGSYEKKVLRCEAETRKYDKRSIVSKVLIPKDTIITEEMLTYKRPGTGIWPVHLSEVVGKKATETIIPDSTLQWSMIN